jgi:hypothetical protein
MPQQPNAKSVQSPSFDYSYVKTPTSIMSSGEAYKTPQDNTKIDSSTAHTLDFYIRQQFCIIYTKNPSLPSFPHNTDPTNNPRGVHTHFCVSKPPFQYHPQMSQHTLNQPPVAQAPAMCQKYFQGYQRCSHMYLEYPTIIKCVTSRRNDGRCDCRTPVSIQHPGRTPLAGEYTQCFNPSNGKIEKWMSEDRHDRRPPRDNRSLGEKMKNVRTIR